MDIVWIGFCIVLIFIFWLTKTKEEADGDIAALCDIRVILQNVLVLFSAKSSLSFHHIWTWCSMSSLDIDRKRARSCSWKSQQQQLRVTQSALLETLTVPDCCSSSKAVTTSVISFCKGTFWLTTHARAKEEAFVPPPFYTLAGSGWRSLIAHVFLIFFDITTGKVVIYHFLLTMTP